MTEEQELWIKVKDLLKAENDEDSFNINFGNINDIYKSQNGYIYLVVENSLAKFRLEKFYLNRMNELLEKISPEKRMFKFITESEAQKEEEKKNANPLTDISPDEKVIKNRTLRPEYTFENFVTGEANREAFTFSVRVAESPNVTINPFYIFGDVGLGKTHLMTAIGHYILDNDINKNVVYTTAQQFVEDYFKSKNKNQKNTLLSEEFDKHYRNADVLLVDDVQYLADRQGSQDEFFKIFEYLFENNKQIVITSDRKADELNIMSRLKSRFSWGMQTDIKRPNLELRKAILKDKLKTLVTDPFVVSDDVITYIAENMDQNVRELEGALRRFIYYCVSFNYDFTVENAQLALESIIPKDRMSLENNKTRIEKIKEIIASYYNINPKELSSASRKAEYVYVRNVTVYILKTKYNLTLNKIGSSLGGRDHATISHSYDKMVQLLASDENVKLDIENLTKQLDKMYTG